MVSSMLAIITAFSVISYCQSDTYTCSSGFLPFNSSTTKGVSFDQYASTVIPTDPMYDDIRRHAANLIYLANIGYIVSPETVDQVANVLQHAVENNLRPTVRSGGHCTEDFWSNNSNGVLIDMSSMNKIYKSTDGLIWIEAGATLRQVYTTLYKQWGLTIPAGTCLDIGIGGHALGGGYGYLTRIYGLVIDHIEAFEMIRVNEKKKVEIVNVTKDSITDRDKNLFWGLRGGGNQNFGIVTKIGFGNLPKSPPKVYLYDAKIILKTDINRSKFIDIMDKFARFMVANSKVGNPYCDMDVSIILDRWRFDATMSIYLKVIGENNTHLAESFIAYLGLAISEFTCEEVSFYRAILLNGEIDDASSKRTLSITGSAFMINSFPMDQLQTIWMYMTDAQYNDLFHGRMILTSCGCAVNRLTENATAYPHRRAVIMIMFNDFWQKDADAALSHEWSHDFYRSLYGDDGPKSNNLTDGCYVNYPDRSLIDWQHLYFKDNYERLQRVKAQWDPLNVFHHRQSIELPNGYTVSDRDM